MADALVNNQTVTFTITKVPKQLAQKKTLRRLMQLQPEIQKGLKALQKRRRLVDNRTYIRAGVWWTDRKRATKLVRVETGATFTLNVRPQIMPDLRSVEAFLDAKPA